MKGSWIVFIPMGDKVVIKADASCSFFLIFTFKNVYFEHDKLVCTDPCVLCYWLKLPAELCTQWQTRYWGSQVEGCCAHILLIGFPGALAQSQWQQNTGLGRPLVFLCSYEFITDPYVEWSQDPMSLISTVPLSFNSEQLRHHSESQYNIQDVFTAFKMLMPFSATTDK